MTMIVAPDGRTPLTAKPRTADGRKLADFATLKDVAECRAAMVDFASVLEQVMEKLARVEDRLGITDESVVPQVAPPTGEGDTE